MNKFNHSKVYLENKSKKVDDICICPSCKVEFNKRTYQQVFCGQSCKDGYWNKVDPTKRNNTRRISPASNRWLNSRKGYFHPDNDLSWDAHKQD